MKLTEMQMEMLNSKTLKHAFLVLILAASFGSLGGCATVEGAGKDIQRSRNASISGFFILWHHVSAIQGATYELNNDVVHAS